MPEPIEHQYFLIGHISRSHGVDGTVLFVPIPEAAEPTLFEQIEMVWLQNKRGDLVPARINSVRVQEQDGRVSFFIKFVHITDRTRAEELNGRPVLVEQSRVEGIISAQHTWHSFDVFNDRHENIGLVEDVIENPAHFIINVSTDKGNLLIPCVDEYVTKVDEESEVIHCKNLDQLKSLE